MDAITFPTYTIILILAAVMLSRLADRKDSPRLAFLALASLFAGMGFILIQLGMEIQAFLSATTPVCTLAMRPRLTRKEYRAELSASRVRRAARAARAAKAKAIREKVESTAEPTIHQLPSGTWVIVTSKGTLHMGFADYPSADAFRIRYMEKARKATSLPSRIKRKG